MTDEPSPIRDAHVERPSRRRDLASVGLSFVVHGLAMFVLLFFATSTGGTVTESNVTADVILQEAARAVPVEAPAPTQAPVPTRAPRPTHAPVVPVRLAARPVRRRAAARPTPPPPRHRELSRYNPLAPGQPTPPPSAPPTAPPTVPPTREPTAAPTAVVAVAPEEPTAAPTAEPTLPPTPRPPAPTAPPTQAATAPPRTPAPTVVPTAAPTAAPATAAPTAHPTAAATSAPTARPTAAPTQAAIAAASAAPTAVPGTPRPVASAAALGSPRPAEAAGPRPAASGPPGPATGAPGPAARGASSPGPGPGPGAGPSTGTGTTPASSAPVPGAVRTAATPGPAARGTASPSTALDNLNARLRAMLPHGDVAPGHFTPGLDRDAATSAYEAALAPPAEVLAATFGLIRVKRTLVHADSITYVFERKRDILGREVCKAYRITDHPLPPPPTAPPSLQGGQVQMMLPGPPRDIKPIIEYVDVSCNDGRMERIVPGTLKTPVPRHP